jgi:hypothetical protein
MSKKNAPVLRRFTLPVALENPVYDKRCSYDVRAVSHFESGSIITVVETRLPSGEITVQYAPLHPVPEKFRDVLNKLFKPFDPEADVEPVTVEQAAETCGLAPQWLCRYAVQQLVDEGRLSIEELIRAYGKSSG